MSTSTDIRRLLEAGDAEGLSRAWRVLHPHLPQPKTHHEKAVILHRARTGASSIPVPKRLYSHAWLVERGLPSGLPDELRPPHERQGSVIVEAVGVSVRARNPARREDAAAIERAMSDAAAEAQADGLRDPKAISARMWEARDRVLAQ